MMNSLKKINEILSIDKELCTKNLDVQQNQKQNYKHHKLKHYLKYFLQYLCLTVLTLCLYDYNERPKNENILTI